MIVGWCPGIVGAVGHPPLMCTDGWTSRLLYIWPGILLAMVCSTQLRAEPVCVKYGPCPLSISTFECSGALGTSFVRRVCHDHDNRFMVIDLAGTWYPHCGVDALSVLELLSAPSVGRHYNKHFRSRPDGTRGPFDCRDHPMPVDPR